MPEKGFVKAIAANSINSQLMYELAAAVSTVYDLINDGLHTRVLLCRGCVEH